MSIQGGIFKNDDGELIKMKDVVSVEPLDKNEGRPSYIVNTTGGMHVSIKQGYFKRADFVTAWRTT